MPATIPDSHLDLVQKPLTVTLATVLSDGQPHLTAVWVIYEPDGDLLISTLIDSQKAKNIQDNPQTSILAIDTEQPYRYLEVRCHAVLQQDEKVPDIRRRIMVKYGRTPTEDSEPVKRVILRLTPTDVLAHGSDS